LLLIKKKAIDGEHSAKIWGRKRSENKYYG
jgi:hypothetical protein